MKNTLYRSTMEFAYDIMLDQKFLYRSVHAAFVNTKWYETWSERTLFVDPIIYDVQGPGVLSRMQGQPCNCRYTRHISQWVAAAVAGCTRSDVFPQLSSPTCRGDAANPSLESAFSTHLVVPRIFCRVTSSLAIFCRVTPLLAFTCSFRLSQHAFFACISDHGWSRPQFSTPPSYRSTAAAAENSNKDDMVTASFHEAF